MTLCGFAGSCRSRGIALADGRGLRFAVTLAACWVLGCSGKQTGDEGGTPEASPTRVVDNQNSEPSEVDPEIVPDGAVDQEEERGSGGSEAGGPLDTCGGVVWPSPDAARVEASCVQVLELDSGGPGYRCSCDQSACPVNGRVVESDEPDGTPQVEYDDCLVELESPAGRENCRQALQDVCGVAEGDNGFCERQYYKLSPTHEGQVTPESATVACFETDAGHSCVCSLDEEPVVIEQSDCQLAMREACHTPCESELGSCEPTADGFDCTCGVGIGGFSEALLCEHALHHWCAPNCENERGACYLDPNGVPEIACTCNDDPTLHRMAMDPNVQGDECRTPLVETCGGSPEDE